MAERRPGPPCRLIPLTVPMPGLMPVLLALLLALLPGAAPFAAGWTVPDDLAERVDGLTPEQAAFLTSGAALEFMAERQLEHELSTRNDEALAQLLDDLMALAAQMAYDPERDMGAIPLNLDARYFGLREPTPEPLRELERAPGPFSVHRYQFPGSGVPTFAGAKVAIYPEDLVAGKVDVAIVGIPSNASSGRRDAASGPDALRALHTLALPDERSLIDPMAQLSVVDYGNFMIDNLSQERTAESVTRRVAETAATGAVPMLVGGDTSLLYPGVKGVFEAGDEAFGLLHFSAHPEANRQDAHTISDDQAVHALLSEGIVDGPDTILFGIRGAAADRETLAWLKGQRVRYHTLVSIRERGFERSLKTALREVDRGPERFYVSVDVSVLRPADMPAAGRITPGGLAAAEVTRAIRAVCADKKIVGFEVTDLAPALDPTRVSTLHAGALINACLNGMAVRSAGLDADDIHPLVAGHGQR
jgi:agmatinase